MRDVVVVGAGPAGALAAIELAGASLDVLLVDRARFPRSKVCGSCLLPAALATLAAAGLGGIAERLGARPLCRLELRAGGRKAVLDLPGGVALSREALDAALVAEAVRRGAEFRDGVRAEIGRDVVLNGAETVRARVVIAAGGLAGEPARGSYVGAGVVFPSDACAPGTVRMACARGGYVGLVQVEAGRCAAAAALAPDLVAGGLERAVAGILDAADAPALPRGLAWRGTPRLTRRPARAWAPGVLFVGDAAGYVEPFTGEGIAWALASARAAAPVAREVVRSGWTAATGPIWERRRRAALGARPWRCRALTLGLRVPWLARTAVAILEHSPALAGPLVRATSGA